MGVEDGEGAEHGVGHGVGHHKGDNADRDLILAILIHSQHRTLIIQLSELISFVNQVHFHLVHLKNNFPFGINIQVFPPNQLSLIIVIGIS